eukprot:TRINITY_DN12701_c0_g2_i1.p1 TRINITY_DN12701_c0_g2~~TRINITY_DN12701_c0_g2_i1.p1  ORF type:complete len:199 (-),score=26.36 TRINITY_DN12701_c0_g2_i1:107-703(-)
MCIRDSGNQSALLSPCTNSTDAYPSAFGCYPVAVDGLYDLSVQNLYPILPQDNPMYDPHVPYLSNMAEGGPHTAFQSAIIERKGEWIDATGTVVIGDVNGTGVEVVPGVETLPVTAPSDGEARGRLVAVAILALAYGVLFAGIVVKSLRGVNGYVMKVMRIQSRNSLGYRTVLIRGVPERLLPGSACLLYTSPSPRDS